MRKRLLAIVMAAIMGLSAVGCTSYQESTDISQDNLSFGGGYFTQIKQWYDIRCDYYIVYANDTKVMYFIAYQAGNVSKFGITPLYNADGSVQVYDGE